jgi:hypothetical protein
VALLSSVLAAVGATRTSAAGVSLPYLPAYHTAFVVAALLALLAAGLALLVPDRDAAPSMRRRSAEQPPVADEVAV